MDVPVWKCKLMNIGEFNNNGKYFKFSHGQSFPLYKSGIGKLSKEMQTPFWPGPTTKI
jgi:hypothetical protein